MMEVAVLLQLLSFHHARLNVAFRSHAGAAAAACFPLTRIVFRGVLQGTAAHGRLQQVSLHRFLFSGSSVYATFDLI